MVGYWLLVVGGVRWFRVGWSMLGVLDVAGGVWGLGGGAGWVLRQCFGEDEPSRRYIRSAG